MVQSKTTNSVWTTAPERLFADIAAPGVHWDAERVQAGIRLGLNTLQPNNVEGLILPPCRAFAPKRIRGRKDLHVHRYLEVGIVLRGEMALWWEGTTTRCLAGNVFLIPPGTRYLPHVLDSGKVSRPHSILWLALHRGGAVAHICSLEGKIHQLSEYYFFTDTQVVGQARSLSQELADRSPYFETVVRGSLLCLLSWLLRAPVHSIAEKETSTDDLPGSNSDAFLQRVKSYFLSHYHRPISLTQIAHTVGCSSTYLCRHFRELTGQTPFQYLRSLRIEAAKRLLCSEVPIARVAEMVGFDDPLYFSKVFSRQTGTPPQTFRLQNRSRP